MLQPLVSTQRARERTTGFSFDEFSHQADQNSFEIERRTGPDRGAEKISSGGKQDVKYYRMQERDSSRPSETRRSSAESRSATYWKNNNRKDDVGYGRNLGDAYLRAEPASRSAQSMIENAFSDLQSQFAQLPSDIRQLAPEFEKNSNYAGFQEKTNKKFLNTNEKEHRHQATRSLPADGGFLHDRHMAGSSGLDGDHFVFSDPSSRGPRLNDGIHYFSHVSNPMSTIGTEHQNSDVLSMLILLITEN